MTNTRKEDMVAFARQSGMSEEAIAEMVTRMDYLSGLSDKLESAGIKRGLRNGSFWQLTVTGETWPIRKRLASLGYRWDTRGRCWYRDMEMNAGSMHDQSVAADEELVEILS